MIFLLVIITERISQLRDLALRNDAKNYKPLYRQTRGLVYDQLNSPWLYM